MMTKDEALKMAIEALDLANGATIIEGIVLDNSYEINACKEALEQPAQGVELEWYVKGWDDAKRAWQGLTDDEIQAIRIKTFDAVATNYEAYRAIEQALKDKNT
jgi:hypothetical protein